MDTRRRVRSRFRVACAALALLAAGCWDESYEDPNPPPPFPAWVSIEDHDTRVTAATAWLEGEAECPGCFASGWQYGSCPVITCPSAEGSTVRWSNLDSGASGDATHGIVPACHCPWPWGYGYCYTACNHVWWTGVPLQLGDNEIVVSAIVPGYDEGSDSILIQRVPEAPAWATLEPGPGQVTLSWTAVAGATSYNLYWSTTPYGWSSLCTRLENVTSPYTHTGLASGVPHYYFVTALAGDAESFDSLQESATPQ